MVVNTLNNKIYIGQTIQLLCQRKAKHYYDAKRGNRTHFGRALIAYDESVLEWDILEEVPDIDLNEAEIFWIAYFKSIGAELYNLTNGGESNKGYKYTEEQRRRLSEAHKKPKAELPPKVDKRYRPLSEEHRRKLSEAKRGKPSPNKGKITSAETRLKQSIARCGTPSPRKGVVVSNETRRKMSEAAKRRYNKQ